ncbi:hypothetical protein CsatB_004006 [Cannabis sativa]
MFSVTEYKINVGYCWFGTENDRVAWCNEVWCRLNSPKHSFLTWLALQNRLKTRERLFKYKIIDSPDCILCSNDREIVDHLFFKCETSLDCLKQLKDWLNWQVNFDSLQGLLKWIRKSNNSKFLKNVKMATVATLVYSIWRARNDLFWNSNRQQSAEIVKQIKWAIKNRIMFAMPKKVKRKDRDWFQLL